ncbi:MAG: hypothetical protein WC627_04360 [Legionella sp.]|jgi:WD40 repeat protein
MQNKNSFFDPTKKLAQDRFVPDSFFDPTKKSARDRFVPKRVIDKNACEFQKAKVGGIFNNVKYSLYGDQLLGALWNIRYSQINTSPVLGLTLPSEPKKIIFKPKINYTPMMDRVLDAPNLLDEFYNTPLCWGNSLYVALFDEVYSYNYEHSQVTQLQAASVKELVVRALACNNNVLAKAAVNDSLYLIDPATDMKIKEIKDLSTYSMVGDKEHGFYLTSKQTNNISYLDIRSKRVTSTYSILDTDTFGLAFHDNSSSLAVSSAKGIRLFDIRYMGQEKLKFSQHLTAVKALAFSPDGSKIVSGGGVTDKSLKLWSARTGQQISEAYLGNQICGVHWLDKNGVFINEGFSENRISCWDVSGIKPVMVAQSTQDQTHTGRVLFAAQNPKKCGQIVTGSGRDENLRFWSINQIKEEPVEKPIESKLSLYRQIR